jgi:hypothetical protein
VHDLRGTFVTMALANGRSEAWISDRTGHRSSAMIAKYKRTARTFGELALGDLVSLVDGLPELKILALRSEAGGGAGPGGGPKGGPGDRESREESGVPNGIRTVVNNAGMAEFPPILVRVVA